mgnify:CR=1 FL=1
MQDWEELTRKDRITAIKKNRRPMVRRLGGAKVPVEDQEEFVKNMLETGFYQFDEDLNAVLRVKV